MSNPDNNQSVINLLASVEDNTLKLTWEFDDEFEFRIEQNTRHDGVITLGTTKEKTFSISLDKLDYKDDTISVFYVWTNAEAGVSIKIPYMGKVSYSTAYAALVNNNAKSYVNKKTGDRISRESVYYEEDLYNDWQLES